ncbi:MAG TPA: hypothetical protein DCS66_03510 [Flavobacteriaceae bacterium]|nr:hypothetical protein [Flavobacteriaceae bacterium]
MKKFKKLFIPADFPMARVFNNAQDHVEEVLTPVTNSVIIDGIILEDIDLVSGSFTSIEHKLGRKPRGYIVIRKSAAQTVYEDVGDYDSRKLFLKLRASGSVTVNLWVF